MSKPNPAQLLKLSQLTVSRRFPGGGKDASVAVIISALLRPTMEGHSGVEDACQGMNMRREATHTTDTPSIVSNFGLNCVHRKDATQRGSSRCRSDVHCQRDIAGTKADSADSASRPNASVATCHRTCASPSLRACVRFGLNERRYAVRTYLASPPRPST